MALFLVDFHFYAKR